MHDGGDEVLQRADCGGKGEGVDVAEISAHGSIEGLSCQDADDFRTKDSFVCGEDELLSTNTIIDINIDENFVVMQLRGYGAG